MYFQYGSYRHPAGEVQISFATERIPASESEPPKLRKTFALTGVLIANGQAAIRSAIESLQSAYAHHGCDAGLYHDDGSRSPHFLDSSAALNGVRVAAFDFPRGDGAEYATHRSYQIRLEAEFGEISGPNREFAFQETLRFVGTGGPRRVWRETLRGRPVRQIVAQQTLCKAFQTGSASGRVAPPHAPSPLWPGFEIAQRRDIEIIAPANTSDAASSWGVQWSYEFESPRPLFGLPRSR